MWLPAVANCCPFRAMSTGTVPAVEAGVTQVILAPSLSPRFAAAATATALLPRPNLQRSRPEPSKAPWAKPRRTVVPPSVGPLAGCRAPSGCASGG